MKTVTYRDFKGQPFTVEYDETAPCRVCHQPVVAASMGGTDVCPSCDCGRCRFCGKSQWAFKESIDGGWSLRELREHVAACKLRRHKTKPKRHPVAPRPAR